MQPNVSPNWLQNLKGRLDSLALKQSLQNFSSPRTFDMSEREHILYEDDVDDCKDRHLNNNKANDTQGRREASITT